MSEVTARGVVGAVRRERLERARLYLVTEARPPGRALEDLVEAALAGGVDIVQLREKAGADEAIVNAARSIRALCDAHGALLVVNDRPDLAAACGADGVHLGQDDLPLVEARAIVGDELLLGISTHTPAQVDAADHSPADYLGVGPVYATTTKPGVAPVGVELVRHAAIHASKPFFAIGGIDATSAGAVVAAGARRLAAARAIRDAASPRDAAAALLAALGATS